MNFKSLAKVASLAMFCMGAFLLYVVTPSRAQDSAAKPSVQLDYEFFKARVEPIFLKHRSDDHARCYVCHQMAHHGGGPFSLEMLDPGATFWTEAQSRKNFEMLSKLVVPGDPSRSLFLRMPMAPESGGLADTHQGGRQFASEDDPDWKNMRAWVMGQKLGSDPGH
jgi:hypothetical protein